MGLPVQRELSQGTIDLILAYSYTLDLKSLNNYPPQISNKWVL
jgi:hypothetical protein